MGNVASFDILCCLGQCYETNLALTDCQVLELCNLATLENEADSTKTIFICNQFLLNKDPNSTKGSLLPAQANAHGVHVCLAANQHKCLDSSASQQKIIVEGTTYLLFFDSYKCYLSLCKPTKQDYKRYPVIELASPSCMNQRKDSVPLRLEIKSSSKLLRIGMPVSALR